LKLFGNILLLILLTPFSKALAVSYDESILQIYSKIIPRLVIMSNVPAEPKKSVSVCTIHNKDDAASAERFSQMIQKNATGGSVTLRIRHRTYEHAAECFDSQLLFLLNGSETQFSRLQKELGTKPIITVAYDPRMLEAGADISLYMGRSVMPYLNLGALRNKGIRFESVLLRVSKVYEGKQP